MWTCHLKGKWPWYYVWKQPKMTSLTEHIFQKHHTKRNIPLISQFEFSHLQQSNDSKPYPILESIVYYYIYTGEKPKACQKLNLKFRPSQVSLFGLSLSLCHHDTTMHFYPNPSWANPPPKTPFQVIQIPEKSWNHPKTEKGKMGLLWKLKLA